MSDDSYEKWQQWKIARRIAADGYPESEARFDNVLEYIRYLETKLRLLKEVTDE